MIAVAAFGAKFMATESAQAQHYTVLYQFTGGVDGAYPYAAVIRDSSGNLYGTTEYGGKYQYGAVFKVSARGTETVLYSFNLAGTGDGEYPFGRLWRDSAGNLYGTTQFGGAFGKGTVFKLDTTGKETILHSFTGGSDGANPRSGLVLDSAVNIYGAAFQGGAFGCGVVFKLDQTGRETTLYTFTCGADGNGPLGLVRDGKGSLYGTTGGGGVNWGVVFKVDPTGTETVLHTFAGTKTEGNYPCAGVRRDSYGNLYGTTQYGGVGYGVVYKLSPQGQETILHIFTGNGADGAQPCSLPVLDSAGNLYGTTYWGGSSNAGTIFKVTQSGNESVLYSFSAAQGAYPYAGLILDAQGNLYGTTVYGGSGYGTVFKFHP